MRFHYSVSYRTSRSKGVSVKRAHIKSKDFASVTGDIISELKRRHQRQVTVVGMYLQVKEAKAVT